LTAQKEELVSNNCFRITSVNLHWNLLLVKGFLLTCNYGEFIMAIYMSPDKPVYVVEHQRRVFGKWQDICSHTRSLPSK